MKLSIRENVLATGYSGGGTTYRRYAIWSDTPMSSGSRHIADIQAIDDEGKAIAERIVEAFNAREEA